MIALPNIATVYYGRDVGYGIERINLDRSVQDVSATKERAKLTAQSTVSTSSGQPEQALF